MPEFPAPFHADLMCFVRTVAYRFDQRLGVLRMVDSCCDMNGCIAFFARIDPEVAQIQTYQGDVPDTWYFKERTGEWTAHEPPAGRA